ncbi:MAG TPA: hypothetical protein VJ487_18930 [Alphaproteobacteria bacterium]|nr:hypothetical protein [Alphaproteobacteria bacterium]
MKKLGQLIAALLLGAAAAGLAASAWAQMPRGDRGFRDHDPGHFTEHDWGVWRGGNWNHAWHDGRLGWWWVVGPYWYFYPQPIYPYPDPYLPPSVVAQPGPAGPAPAQFWYYCDSPPGYYPYVTSCSAAWRQVPVTPQAPKP